MIRAPSPQLSAIPAANTPKVRHDAAPTGTATAQSSRLEPAANVRISGEARMLSRLFGSADALLADPDREVAPSTSGSMYGFLQGSDRTLLASAYEYASRNGIDAEKVDALAFDLSGYRASGGAKGIRNSDGLLFTPDGRPFFNAFTPEDQAVADRILGSEALRTTAVDQDFVRTLLTPGKMAVHAVDLEFLEAVITDFSATRSANRAVEPRAVTPEPTAPVEEEGAQRVLPRDRSMQLGSFLTSGDRSFLRDVYESHHESEDSRRRVDQLAVALSGYRIGQATGEDRLKTVREVLDQAAESQSDAIGRWLKARDDADRT